MDGAAGPRDNVGVPLIPQSKTRYLRSPSFLARETPTLQVVVWDEAGEHVERFALDPTTGEPGEIEVLPVVPGGVVALEPGDVPTPTDDVDAELRARDGAATVHVRHEGGESIVSLARAGHDDVVVFRAFGSVMAPACAAADGGVWVAFHHDVREDTRVTDVAKWIALRFVTDDGRVLEPSAPMTDRDRDREGVEQSFEFPALVVGASGAVRLYGRGSHDFFRQDLDHTGFSPRHGLTDGEWGSRGRRPTARRFGATTLVAFRDRKGIVVVAEPSPEGGAPALVPAAIAFNEAPARVPATRPDPAARHGLRTAFGDIQQHSAHSDGVGTADEAYLRARHRYGDDFVALTDHESFIGKRTGPGEWAYLQAVATKHDAPGAFATLYAYEWTGQRYPGPGHKCVYLPRVGMPLVSRDDVPEGRALVQSIKALGGIASPHHVGWTGCDEPGHDPVGQPVFEICSCHGCYEHPDHPLGQRGELTDQLVSVMLAKGHRFGFTASSDSHGLLWHHGEARKRDPYRTGLTAVQVRSLHRDDVLEALRARRCYATSGAKILLDVTVNGAPMGSEIVADGPPLAVHVIAHGEGPLARVEVIADGVVAAREDVDAMTHEARFSVQARYLYVRVTQQDGEMAWSSPVFVDAGRRVGLSDDAARSSHA